MIAKEKLMSISLASFYVFLRGEVAPHIQKPLGHTKEFFSLKRFMK